MSKLIHPIKFDQKRKVRGLAAVAVLVALVAYWILNQKITISVTKNVAENGFGKILSTPISYKRPGVSFELPKAKWVPQTFNNCGPAATSMVLQYFGYNVSQVETKAHLRTNPDDKNVFIDEISSYIKNDYGVDNKVLYNGELKIIKTLVSNGVYVVVEDWLHPNEDIGHVLIIHGFDDAEGVLIADDPFLELALNIHT